MSQLRTPEGEKSREQEQNLPKTGLEIIKMVVGENPIQWIETRSAHHQTDLELTMVGNNDVWGRFKIPNTVSFLEGAVKTKVYHGVENWLDLSNVARKLREVRGEEVILLAHTDVDDGEYPSEQLRLYEVPRQKVEGIIEELNKEASRKRGRGTFHLSAGILGFDFPTEGYPGFSHGLILMHKKPWGEDFKLGEAVPFLEEKLEESRKLEEFLVENRSLFEDFLRNCRE